MGFDLTAYSKLRPTVWHLTHRDNIARIRTTGKLVPAAGLLLGPIDRPRRLRDVGKSGVILRDQDLLNEKSVDLDSGAFIDFLRDLGRRVFFWSGGVRGPVRAGRRALARYASTDVVLRVSFDDVTKTHVPQFTNCNSGATRMQNGQRVRRGLTTFRASHNCPFRPTDVIEVTFVGEVLLPASTEWSNTLGGKFNPLFERAG